jgi:carboxypeptidase Taq
MPPKALAFRAGQLAHFSGQAHRLVTAKKVGDWISACEQHGFAAGSGEAANVREWRRLHDRATRVPARLVEKFQRVCTPAREAWRAARERSEFNVFKPHLQKVLELNRQMADCWGYQESPYDALVEEYERASAPASFAPCSRNCVRPSSPFLNRPWNARPLCRKIC